MSIEKLQKLTDSFAFFLIYFSVSIYLIYIGFEEMSNKRFWGIGILIGVALFHYWRPSKNDFKRLERK